MYVHATEHTALISSGKRQIIMQIHIFAAICHRVLWNSVGVNVTVTVSMHIL
ncbi:hypothetical protein EBME_0089 [bacterium endosymbiont of Mortierella elongata FMR23-6]|nr:hypothetical protein EBME_0089 [bacterium endosymbiont of Mortierella elongata FMR23-6]